MNDRHEKISKRAYELWEAHGRPHGRNEEHWKEAVRHIDATQAELSVSAKPARKRETKPSASVDETAVPAANKIRGRESAVGEHTPEAPDDPVTRSESKKAKHGSRAKSAAAAPEPPVSEPAAEKPKSRSKRR